MNFHAMVTTFEGIDRRHGAQENLLTLFLAPMVMLSQRPKRKVFNIKRFSTSHKPYLHRLMLRTDNQTKKNATLFFFDLFAITKEDTNINLVQQMRESILLYFQIKVVRLLNFAILIIYGRMHHSDAEAGGYPPFPIFFSKCVAAFS